MKFALCFVLCFIVHCSAIEREAHCNQICPRIYRPICGSDGNTYANDCLLRVHNCLNDDNVVVAYDGPCVVPSSTVPPDMSVG
ncbi:serine protease inhibitor Kazal-type 1-like [Saccostrea cucullata]|uniref:serine protease inhibitor Kazal-type 1-like n=1 Tax=Saccostrea cuccullata TaxID=36930 RepID=UPI002ED51E6F